MQPHRSRVFAFRSLLLFGFWLLLLEPDSLSPADIGVDWAVGAFAAFAAVAFVAGLSSEPASRPAERRGPAPANAASDPARADHEPCAAAGRKGGNRTRGSG